LTQPTKTENTHKLARNPDGHAAAAHLQFQLQALQSPLVLLRNSLPGGRDIRLGGEQAANPHAGCVKASQAGTGNVPEALQLVGSQSQIGYPGVDRHVARHLVPAPAIEESTCAGQARATAP